ncbi:MAG: hypothetical protein ACHQ1G_09900, partial [Planctomycetota bacterium]
SLSALKARERLRFRRRAAAYEVLVDPAFAPLDQEGAVVLRTPQGAKNAVILAEVIGPPKGLRRR